MIRVVARCQIRPGQLEQALAIYAELAQRSRAEDGCQEYVVCRNVAEAQALAVLETWRDEAALKAHQQTPHFTRLVPKLQELRENAQVDVYEPVI